MKRKVLLALVLALVLCFSAVPVSADGYIEYPDDFEVDTITSFKQLDAYIKASTDSDYGKIGKIYITKSIETNNLAELGELGDGLDSIPTIQVDKNTTEWPIKVFPAYDFTNNVFTQGKNGRISEAHKFTQDYKWETKLLYVYALNGVNKKDGTVDHGVVDTNGNDMLPVAVEVEGFDRATQSTGNMINFSLDEANMTTPKELNVKYSGVLPSETNQGYNPTSDNSISKSYHYSIGLEYLSSVGIDDHILVLGAFRITKADSEDKEKLLEGAKFRVYADSNLSEEATQYDAATDTWVPVGEVTTGSDGTVVVSNLKAGTYYVKETKAPNGYLIDDENAHPVEVKTPNVSYSLSGGQGAEAVVNLNPVQLNPEWEVVGGKAGRTQTMPFKSVAATTDYANNYNDADVFIQGGGKTVTVVSTGVDLATLEGAYQNLNGTKYVVKVGGAVKATEDTLSAAIQYVNETLIVGKTIDAEGYRTHVTIEQTTQNAIYAPTAAATDIETVPFTDTATIDFRVDKSWINLTAPCDEEYLRVQLYQVVVGTEDPGTPYGPEVELAKDSDWTYTWKNLPGKGYTYYVKEVSVPQNYELKGIEYGEGKTEDGRVLITAEMTNSQIIQIVARKTWKGDKDEDRPEAIKVQLYKDKQAVGEPVELNENNNWSHWWANMEGGHDYEVKEVGNVEGYVTTTPRPVVGGTEDGYIVLDCEIVNEFATPPLTFDNSFVALGVAFAMLIMVAVLKKKIQKTSTK